MYAMRIVHRGTRVDEISMTPHFDGLGGAADLTLGRTLLGISRVTIRKTPHSITHRPLIPFDTPLTII